MDLQSIMDSFEPYIKLGVISQHDLDQGDSANRDGVFFALAGLLKAPKDFMGRDLPQGWEETIKQHEASPGLYRRSPDPSYWGYRVDTTSRDQQQALMLGMAIMGDKKRLKEAWKGLMSRFGFHTNKYPIWPDTDSKPKIPDFLGITEVTSYIRGMSKWYLYPVLCLLDLGYLIDLKLRGGQKWDYDNLLAPSLLYANKKYMTPASWLAMKLYKKTDWLEQIHNYYRDDNGNNGIMPMYELYKKAYEELT